MEKFEFVKSSVSWISSRSMENCFILNFGYDAPLPWPQVRSKKSEFLAAKYAALDATMCGVRPSVCPFSSELKFRIILQYDV